jgi:hypothetical protein
MHDIDDDSALLRQQKHFLQQVEIALRKVNREVIHAHIPDLNKDSFVRLAHYVAEARSRYLGCALALIDGHADPVQAAQHLHALRQAREVFEESRDAFAALERAIEQGYVDIKA